MAPAFRFIDLFAGIGGFHLAASRSGGRCVFASEWDRWAQQTYSANFPGAPLHGDITKIAPSDVPDHDVLTAGFPCQPFSIAGVSKRNSLGYEHGFRHPTQGTLFFNVREIIAAKQPRAFVLENVKNLRNHDRGRTYEVILRTLREDLGYHVPDPQVIDARYVLPQHRERIFFVGFRDEEDAEQFVWPSFDGDGGKVRDILESDVDPKYTLSDKLWKYLQVYAAKHRAAGNGFGFGLTDLDGVTRTLSARYHKDGSEILIPQKNGANPRRLTPRECARLMGYPNSFVIPVSDTQAYRQFGNSVAVPVVERLAQHVVEALARDVDAVRPRFASEAELIPA